MIGIDLAQRPEWHQHAACRPGSDITTEAELQEHVAAFYPATEFSSWSKSARRRVLLLPCDECSVRSECAEAGQDEISGVWGGITARDRRLARRAARRNERTA
ncbi:MAG: WhiB family transcriptional regulator [Actinomycetota bacterium]